MAHERLLYIQGTAEMIGRILGKQDITKNNFHIGQKISGVLNSHKNNIHLEDQSVYEFPCKDCTKTCIGQNNRRISVKIEQKSTSSL